MMLIRYPNTGNPKLDSAIVMFGLLLFVMSIVSAFRNQGK